MQVTAIVPERSCAGHQHRVVAAARILADESIAGDHRSAISDHHSVADASGTHVQLRTVAPNRVYAGDRRQVIATDEGTTDIANEAVHRPAIADDQLIAVAAATHIEG